VTHPVLVDTPPERTRWEISKSKREGENKVGKPVEFFAYSYVDFNDEVARQAYETRKQGSEQIKQVLNDLGLSITHGQGGIYY
jgi:hypothetical protein